MNNGQPPACLLKLNDIEVNKFLFEKKEILLKQADELNLSIQTEVQESAEKKDDYRVVVNITLNDDVNGKIHIDIEMSGYFSFINNPPVNDNEKETLLNKNTLAIMFPYIRSYITSVTAQAGINPIILPAMNINLLVEESIRVQKQ